MCNAKLKYFCILYSKVASRQYVLNAKYLLKNVKYKQQTQKNIIYKPNVYVEPILHFFFVSFCFYSLLPDHNLKRQVTPKRFLQNIIVIMWIFITRDVGVESFFTIYLGIGDWWDQVIMDFFKFFLNFFFLALMLEFIQYLWRYKQLVFGYWQQLRDALKFTEPKDTWIFPENSTWGT